MYRSNILLYHYYKTFMQSLIIIFTIRHYIINVRFVDNVLSRETCYTRIL